MIKRRERTLAELEAHMVKGRRKTRVFLLVLLGVGMGLFVINALAREPGAQGSLAQQWWSLIPILFLAAGGAIGAARSFWLRPRSLEVQRRLTELRPLHAPWAAARAVEQRLGESLRHLPEASPVVEAGLRAGRQELERRIDVAVEGEIGDVLERRIARIEAYRVALSTLEADALLKRGFLGSSEAARSLERAVELLAESHARNAGIDQSREPAARFESIAILPFNDLSPLGDNEYFGQGLADELISSLNRIQGLRVTARGRAFPYADQGLGVREIGRRLAVDTVLEGSVQKVGDRLRVTAQLQAVTEGRELWAGDFDEPLKKVMDIGNQLVEGVVGALGVKPSRDEQRAIEKSPTQVVGAYDFYLRGRRYFAQYHGRGMQFALEMFERAIGLDAQYALAWAGLADCCAYLYANKGRDPEFRQRALEASTRALELDPELPEAHVSRAVALSLGGLSEEAAQFFETALRLNPKLFEAHYFYARHCFTAGDPEKAIELYESAAELRPEDYQVPLLSAQIYDDLGRGEEARAIRERGVEVAEEHIRLNPDDARALYIGANGLVSLGQIEKGMEWARLARELQPSEPMALYNLACVYSLAGNSAEAIDCFAACVANGFSYRDWAEHDSNLDAIRDDPRFLELMKEL